MTYAISESVHAVYVPVLAAELLAVAASLAIVDTDGLKALTMRRLGSELGVDAMSIYKHVANKDALLGGIVEQLWAEIGAAVSDNSDWAGQVRSFAHAIRTTAHRHPRAATLLFGRLVLTPQVLQTFAALLDALREAGFGDTAAARVVRSLVSYVIGYASTELYWFDSEPELPPPTPTPTPTSPPPTCSSSDASSRPARRPDTCGRPSR